MVHWISFESAGRVLRKLSVEVCLFLLPPRISPPDRIIATTYPLAPAANKTAFLSHMFEKKKEDNGKVPSLGM
jgi:hypothetical protein